jgi:hypothetical protein
MEGHFKTFRHHAKQGEPLSEGAISLVCDTLCSFAVNLGSAQVPQKERNDSGLGVKGLMANPGKGS